MCVILVCNSRIPTLSDLNKCEADNDDGGGISYRVENRVRYVKGLSANDIHSIINGRSDPSAKGPFIIHFRKSSSGFPKTPDLCHPFAVNKMASSKISGDVGKVLFHNGTWPNWKEFILAMLPKTNIRVPAGQWSDSRALALIVRHKGEGILNFIPGKFAVMSRTGIRTYGDGWTEDSGILMSNTYWKTRGYASSSVSTVYASTHCSMGCD